MAYVIAEPCVDVKDLACVAVCPVDCIYEFEGENQLFIHPEECIDCDACRPECPVEAIFPLEDVPSQWQQYIELNSVIFETRSLDERVGGGALEPVEEAQPAAVAVSAGEMNALSALLAAVASKESSVEEALDDVLAALEKLGVEIES